MIDHSSVQSSAVEFCLIGRRMEQPDRTCKRPVSSQTIKIVGHRGEPLGRQINRNRSQPFLRRDAAWIYIPRNVVALPVLQLKRCRRYVRIPKNQMISPRNASSVNVVPETAFFTCLDECPFVCPSVVVAQDGKYLRIVLAEVAPDISKTLLEAHCEEIVFLTEAERRAVCKEIAPEEYTGGTLICDRSKELLVPTSATVEVSGEESFSTLHTQATKGTSDFPLAALARQWSNPPMDAVIFDMDGVIVDSEPIYDQVTAEHLLELGVAADPAFFDTLRGLDLIDVWKRIQSEYALPQPVDELAEASRMRLDDHFEHLNPLEPTDGCIELLSRLGEERIPLALASSSRSSRIEIILRRLKIRDAFAVAIGGEQVSNGKPSPEIFLKAAELLNVTAASCVVIEDSTRGLEAARAAGMTRVGVITDAGPPAADFEADLVVGSLSELDPARLRRLVRERANGSRS